MAGPAPFADDRDPAARLASLRDLVQDLRGTLKRQREEINRLEHSNAALTAELAARPAPAAWARAPRLVPSIAPAPPPDDAAALAVRRRAERENTAAERRAGRERDAGPSGRLAPTPAATATPRPPAGKAAGPSRPLVADPAPPRVSALLPRPPRAPTGERRWRRAGGDERGAAAARDARLSPDGEDGRRARGAGGADGGGGWAEWLRSPSVPETQQSPDAALGPGRGKRPRPSPDPDRTPSPTPPPSRRRAGARAARAGAAGGSRPPPPRSTLPSRGFACVECARFYEVLRSRGEVDAAARLRCGHGGTAADAADAFSRHRAKGGDEPPPLTPAGYWNMGFEDSPSSARKRNGSGGSGEGGGAGGSERSAEGPSR